MTERTAGDAVTALLHEADDAFAAGDAERYAALFADDAHCLLLHREAIEGRTAIRDFWRGFFDRFDTSEWEPRLELVEAHEDRAYAFGTYTERLRSREDGSRRLVRGRLVHFLGRDGDDGWRIRLVMNSHSHPIEALA